MTALVSRLLENIHDIINDTNKFYEKINMLELDSVFYEQGFTDVLRENNELMFRNSIDFLYILYYERAGVNIKFIRKHLTLARIDEDKYDKHYNIVHDIRTLHSHNPSLERRATFKKNFQMWCLVNINSNTPNNEADWMLCVEKVFTDACSFLQDTYLCLCSICTQENEDILKDWKLYRDKNLSKYTIEQIVDEVIGQYSLQINSTSFVKMNIDAIQRYLAITTCTSTVEAKSIVKKKIEAIIFDEGLLPCPVTFMEISNAFKAQGKEAGILKKQAEVIFKNNPYLSSTEIIELIKAKQCDENKR